METPAALVLLLVLVLLPMEAAVSSTIGGSSEVRKPHVEAADEAGYRTYIVQLELGPGHDSMDDDARRAWHLSYLPSETTSLGEPRLLSSYRTVFAAKLTPDELRQVSGKPGFVRSYPNVIYYLQMHGDSGFEGMLHQLGMDGPRHEAVCNKKLIGANNNMLDLIRTTTSSPSAASPADADHYYSTAG